MLRHQQPAAVRAAEDVAPPAATGFVILLNAALVRVLFDAGKSRVYLLGRPLDWACSFRERFGAPCPTCGFTRSIVLALHGNLRAAWTVAPGGAAATIAAMAFAAGLLLLAALRARRSPAATPFAAHLRRASLGCAALVLIVWTGGWATALMGPVNPTANPAPLHPSGHLTSVSTQIK